MDDLEKLRQKINDIDEKILQLLYKRIKICKSVGTAKKKRGLPIRDASRENEVYTRIKQKSIEYGLNSDQVQSLYREIVNMCSAVQE
jgi:chorismate mutase